MRVEIEEFFGFVYDDLRSIRCEFEARPDSGEGFEDALAALRGVFETYIGLLDRLFDGVESVGKDTVAAQPAGFNELGHRYGGELAAGAEGAKQVRFRLVELFGAEAADPRRGLEGRVEAKVVYRFPLTGLGRLSVRTEFELGHTVNVCFFRTVKNMPGVEVSERAAEQIAGLERVLAVGGELGLFHVPE